MQYTTHYKIPKPELTDTINVSDVHNIADKFDGLAYDVETTAKNIKTDEDTRVANENKRIESETLRANSELTRTSNELTRTTSESERVDKESKRLLNESTRTSNETQRVSAENNRTTKESERVTNEQTRQSNEATRVANENKRVTNETYRETTFKRMEDSFNQNAPGDMSKVEYDKDNDGIIDKAKHALSSDIASSVEWNNVQNKPDVAKIEEQLKDNTTKTITQETNVLSLTDNIEGIANISLSGNTLDIAKDPIISDFKGKTQGNTNDNPNAFKIGFNNSLLSPDNGGFEEKAQEEYNKIYSLDGVCAHSGVNVSGKFPQMLFSFNIVEIIERKIGKIQGNNTQEKVAWLKKNTKSIKCNWYGYGTCPSGNVAHLRCFWSKLSKWSEYDFNNKTNSPSLINIDVNTVNDINALVNNDGFIHYLAYSDASNKTTTSNIYTDYINLEVQLNPILRSVGEENKEIVVKSVGKNLFNKTKITKGRLKANIGDEFGKTSDTNGWCTSELIAVKENTTMKISGELAWIVLFNKNKRLVRLVGKESFNGTKIGECYLGFYSCSENIDLSDVQLEYATQATLYEPYKEDKVTINLLEPLKGLPNGTRDTINSDGSNTIKVGKVVLDGSEDWNISGKVKTNTMLFMLKDYMHYKVGTGDSVNLYCDKFEPSRVYDSDTEGLFSAGYNNVVYIRINKTKLSTQDVEGFKKWLKENPTTVYYESNLILTGNKSSTLALKTFKNGSIIIDTEVAPLITVNYPSNINSRINTVENATSSIKNSLGGAWQTLLILADKELKMRSISKLTTTDALSNKINEIIGVW